MYILFIFLSGTRFPCSLTLNHLVCLFDPISVGDLVGSDIIPAFLLLFLDKTVEILQFWCESSCQDHNLGWANGHKPWASPPQSLSPNNRCMDTALLLRDQKPEQADCSIAVAAAAGDCFWVPCICRIPVPVPCYQCSAGLPKAQTPHVMGTYTRPKST